MLNLCTIELGAGRTTSDEWIPLVPPQPIEVAKAFGRRLAMRSGQVTRVVDANGFVLSVCVPSAAAWSTLSLLAMAAARANAATADRVRETAERWAMAGAA